MPTGRKILMNEIVAPKFCDAENKCQLCDKKAGQLILAKQIHRVIKSKSFGEPPTSKTVKDFVDNLFIFNRICITT